MRWVRRGWARRRQSPARARAPGPMARRLPRSGSAGRRRSGLRIPRRRTGCSRPRRSRSCSRRHGRRRGPRSRALGRPRRNSRQDRVLHEHPGAEFDVGPGDAGCHPSSPWLVARHAVIRPGRAVSRSHDALVWAGVNGARLVHVFSCYTSLRGRQPEHHVEVAPATTEAGQAGGGRPRHLGVGPHDRGTGPTGRRGPSLFGGPKARAGGVEVAPLPWHSGASDLVARRAA